jgi:hypothetical protein
MTRSLVVAFVVLAACLVVLVLAGVPPFHFILHSPAPAADPAERMKLLREALAGAKASTATEYVPATQGDIRDLHAPALAILRQLPGVVAVDVTVAVRGRRTGSSISAIGIMSPPKSTAAPTRRTPRCCSRSSLSSSKSRMPCDAWLLIQRPAPSG